jgi:hypothetical protein
LQRRKLPQIAGSPPNQGRILWKKAVVTWHMVVTSLVVATLLVSETQLAVATLLESGDVQGTQLAVAT